VIWSWRMLQPLRRRPDPGSRGTGAIWQPLFVRVAATSTSARGFPLPFAPKLGQAAGPGEQSGCWPYYSPRMHHADEQSAQGRLYRRKEVGDVAWYRRSEMPETHY